MTDENTGIQPPKIPNTVTVKVKTSKSAIWSLICGILGAILCLPSIPAIILGILAIININKSKGLLKGTGMAIAGLILSGLSMITAPFIIVMVASNVLVDSRITPRIYANEASAVASLEFLYSYESKWKQQDADGNGIKDYWTYDISCFNRMYRADGTTKVGIIDISLARADGNRATDNIFGTSPAIEPWSTGPTQLSFTTKSGYDFQAMKLDENGNSYNQNEVGENKIKATNDSKFAFVAYPEIYCTSGVHVFIINEKGNVYSTDLGTDSENKIVLKWPGQDPTKQGWQIEDHY